MSSKCPLPVGGTRRTLGGVQELVPIPPSPFARLDGVIPLGTSVVMFDVQLGHLLIGHDLPPTIFLVRPLPSHRQPRRGARAAQQRPQQLQVAQRLAPPLPPYLAEQ